MFQGRRKKPFKAMVWLVIPLGLMASASMVYSEDLETPKIAELSISNAESRKAISNAISDQLNRNIFPEELTFDKEISKTSPLYKVKYTLQAEMQDHAKNLLKRYKPDYAAIVMMDAKTGEILTLTSFEKARTDGKNLALKATYPAASIFKVITAATAVDKAGVSPNQRIAFNGGNYTLYKRNVLSENVNRWTRFITLRDAFARSINTAFGRLTLDFIEPQDLSDYANKFFFNQEIPADFSIETSLAFVPAEKGFALTEVASGYNRFNTLSPVHGAMIASAIINDGQMPSPYIVKSIENQNKESIYTGEALNQGQVITAKSAGLVQEMMEQTVLAGTSRKTFRHMVRDRKFKEVEMGGKTGHFSGVNPKGRTDWFIGYASDGESKIAIATITVNIKKWAVKSSALGEMMFREYFKTKIEERQTSLTETSAPAPVRKPARSKKRG